MQFETTRDPVILALAAITLVYFAAIVALTNRLKRYPAAWEQAGRFLLLANNTPITGILFLKFLFSGSYRTLNDHLIAVMVWATRTLLALAIALIAWQWFRATHH